MFHAKQMTNSTKKLSHESNILDTEIPKHLCVSIAWSSFLINLSPIGNRW